MLDYRRIFSYVVASSRWSLKKNGNRFFVTTVERTFNLALLRVAFCNRLRCRSEYAMTVSMFVAYAVGSWFGGWMLGFVFKSGFRFYQDFL